MGMNIEGRRKPVFGAAPVIIRPHSYRARAPWRCITRADAHEDGEPGVDLAIHADQTKSFEGLFQRSGTARAASREIAGVQGLNDFRRHPPIVHGGVMPRQSGSTWPAVPRR
jgi:hypothetical protein